MLHTLCAIVDLSSVLIRSGSANSHKQLFNNLRFSWPMKICALRFFSNGVSKFLCKFQPEPLRPSIPYGRNEPTVEQFSHAQYKHACRCVSSLSLATGNVACARRFSFYPAWTMKREKNVGTFWWYFLQRGYICHTTRFDQRPTQIASSPRWLHAAATLLLSHAREPDIELEFVPAVRFLSAYPLVAAVFPHLHEATSHLICHLFAFSSCIVVGVFFLFLPAS